MAVPGDVVDVQVCCKRRRYMEGRIVRFVRRSPLRVEPGLRAFRRLRRMQVAEHALRRTAPLKQDAGRRATETHRRNRAARDRPDQGLAADAVLPQQTGIHFQRPALADARGDRRAGRAGAGTGPRLPYSGTVRQGARHPQMLAAARPVERHPDGDQTFLRRERLYVPQCPRAYGADA